MTKNELGIKGERKRAVTITENCDLVRINFSVKGKKKKAKRFRRNGFLKGAV